MSAVRRNGGNRPWMYLFYLVFLGFEPIFDPTTTVWDWLAIVPMVAVFVPIYAWTFYNADRRPYLWSRERGVPGALAGIGAMAALGLICTPLNSGAAAFFIYAAAAAGHLRPRRLALVSMGAIFALVALSAWLSPVPFPYVLAAFTPALIFVPIAGLSSMHDCERQRANAKLAMAQDEIERLAAVAERERIARDLHDLLGHTLSTITLKAELASRLSERDPSRAAAEMRDVERVSRDALAQVRQAVRGYRAQGIQGELANAKLSLSAAGIAFDYYAEPQQLDGERESVLALALREAVTNVVRHAQARHCTVRLEREGSFATLSVQDDGIGGADAHGNGLSSMAARLQTVGGTLRVRDDRGTGLIVSVPLAGPAQTRDTPPTLPGVPSAEPAS